MDRSISPGAAILLDFIGQTEAPKGYGTIYANGQVKLGIDITTWTLDQVQAAQPSWTKRFGSSAAGRYQFMRNTLDTPGTLADIEGEMGLSGAERFDADLQDRMAMHLLRRRGWDSYVAGRLTLQGFALALAKEWASFPVLSSTKGGSRAVVRGQSYYAGDGLNKALVKPEAIEAILAKALAAERSAVPPAPPPAPVPVAVPTCAKCGATLAA
ncbi:hypothetical protein [Methylobacterium frigidaeris]|uniref:Uncharacterized protein n=1 Tax=Methylobacterium frigidaeris TaxID=2038277 RepID=A0AA37HG18_9HYPH|nr:hypothetical protein [Methylobacterium frigidaeris]GJD65193.1 hypothetical protein MPEAHAMD_5380 [Methylobacterium frigidaeris]